MQTTYSLPNSPSPTPRRKLNRDTVSLIGDLLPAFDFGAVLIAAYLATLAFTAWFGSGAVMAFEGVALMALAGAILAPFLLCDRAFVSFASSGQAAAMVRCYLVRFLIFAAVVTVIGTASRALAGLPILWLALWGGMILLTTALLRMLLVTALRRMERQGVLSEVVAIVGSGAGADQLIARLQRRAQRGRVEIIGVFDDRGDSAATGLHAPAGSIADLLELGKTQPIDWILLTQPDMHAGQPQSIVRRLKALSAPIALWSAEDSGPAASPPVEGAASIIAPHVERLDGGWHSTRAAFSSVVPDWISTLLLDLPRAGYRALARRRTHAAAAAPAQVDLTLTLDDYDLAGFAEVAADFGQQRYGYVVTPNADHLARLHRDASFRSLYAQAAYTLLDSQLIAHWMRLTRGLRLPVCTGSDLTASLFADVIRPQDRIVLIGGSERQAAQLRQRYGLADLLHFNPPMGFIHQPEALEACLQYVEAHSPFRYCLLAVGAPQQEQVAQQLKARGVARGLALCVGASINFLTGDERRAPTWMQRLGMEWFYRLLQAPRRMAERYLVRGPRLFGLLRRTAIVRQPAVVAPGATIAAEPAMPSLDTAVPSAGRVDPAGYVTSHRPISRRRRKRFSLALASSTQ